MTVLRIGLTGGIGSGKSTVAELFAELGAAIVDTDAIAREVVEPGTEALESIRRTFGAAVLSTSGELDRRRLRNIVFADPAQRSKLEAIVHPRIRERTLEILDGLAAEYAIVVVPLLLETDFFRLVDRILVVDCPEDVQIRRLMARDRISEDDARAILATQLDRDARLRRADDVIDNGNGLPATREQVALLHVKYLTLAGSAPR